MGMSVNNVSPVAMPPSESLAASAETRALGGLRPQGYRIPGPVPPEFEPRRETPQTTPSETRPLPEASRFTPSFGSRNRPISAGEFVNTVETPLGGGATATFRYGTSGGQANPVLEAPQPEGQRTQSVTGAGEVQVNRADLELPFYRSGGTSTSIEGRIEARLADSVEGNQEARLGVGLKFTSGAFSADALLYSVEPVQQLFEPGDNQVSQLLINTRYDLSDSLAVGVDVFRNAGESGAQTRVDLPVRFTGNDATVLVAPLLTFEGNRLSRQGILVNAQPAKVDASVNQFFGGLKAGIGDDPYIGVFGGVRFKR